MDLTNLSLVALGLGIASFLVGVLILWLIIYSAVAAALGRHRSIVDEERSLRESRAARTARAAQHEDWRG